MTTILMPTRGGPASYPNQERAIRLAQEEEARLVFMYVAHARFLSMAMSPVLVDMETEMEELGEFLLAMAQERAAKEGVEAGTLVYRGLFRKALREAIEDTGADIVVLGRAAGKTGLTTPRYRVELIREIVEATGVQVYVLEEGEIVDRYGPGEMPEESS